MSQCTSEKCEVSGAGRCESSCEAQSGGCQPSCGCPVEMMVEKWQHAFCGAVDQIMREKLKAKIEKAWGNMLDSDADAVIAMMSAGWQAKVAGVGAAMAHEQLKETIAKNMVSSSKK